MHLSQLTLGALSLFVATNAYVVRLFPDEHCAGPLVEERNVWDNTCAYIKGPFKSFSLKTGGGSFQLMTAYEPQNCAGKELYHGCSQGANQVPKNVCIGIGGSAHALSSYSRGGQCPN